MLACRQPDKPLRKDGPGVRTRTAATRHRPKNARLEFCRSDRRAWRGLARVSPERTTEKVAPLRQTASGQLDPIIQFPDNSQSLNPYSYILNNPLSGTDPTGYMANCLGSMFCMPDGGAGGGRMYGGSLCKDPTVCRFALDNGKKAGATAKPEKENKAGLSSVGSSVVKESRLPTFAEAVEPLVHYEPNGRVHWLVDRVAPRGTIVRSAGEALGANAAFAVGVLRRDNAMQNTAVEGMRESITTGDGAAAATMLLGGRAAGGKTHTSYTRTNSDGVVYSGKTSGRGTPEQQVIARTSQADHRAKTQEGYGPGVVDRNSPNADAIRGREQQNILRNGGAQSQGGTSGNAINGVSPTNRKAPQYERACNEAFGCK